MISIHRQWLFPFLVAIALGLNLDFAQGQYYYNPYTAYQAQYAQQLWNAQMMAQAYRGYPGMYQNYYAAPSMAAMYTNPAAAAAVSSSYSSGSPYSSSLENPYTPGAGYSMSANSLYPPYNPYYPNYGYGYSHLMGVADVNRSYGSMMTSWEQARLMREQYNQAKLDTRKKQFELEMYIKSNTPSYNEQQALAARETLKRIQTNSLPGEITSGRALNYLLNDLEKHKNKKTNTDPIQIVDGILSKINVTSKTYGIGLLRDEGKLTWPVALKDILSVKEREDLDRRIQKLVKDGNKGQLDNNALTDLTKEIDVLRGTLLRKVNDVPTTQYMEAKRFLQEFDEASIALRNGEAAQHAKFQKFIDGGRSVQDVVDFMLNQGLRFGPATAADEAAYRTLYSALATYDIAVNATVAAGPKAAD